jgi:hypothetical protein
MNQQTGHADVKNMTAASSTASFWAMVISYGQELGRMVVVYVHRTHVASRVANIVEGGQKIICVRHCRCGLRKTCHLFIAGVVGSLSCFQSER